MKSVDKKDNLNKVRLLLDKLPKISQNLYQPSKQLSIDESLVKFKGRFKYKQYIPSKASKFGIKFYVLAESTTGFLIDWMCSTDKKPNPGRRTENIVFKLLESIEDNSGHELYTDNYYSSIRLAEKLSEKGIGFTGTIRQNRSGMPFHFQKDICNLNSKNRGPLYMRREKLLCTAWFDRKLIFGLSSHLKSGEISVQRKSKSFESGTGMISIPKLFHTYNQYMGGVDLYDQKLKNHSYKHRSYKWPQVVWHLVRQVILNNAFILYTYGPNNRLDSKKFKLSVARSLMFSRDSPAPTIINGCYSANLVWIDSTNKRKRKDCVICKTKRQKRSQVSHKGSNCSLALCYESLNRDNTCFQSHIKSQFSN